MLPTPRITLPPWRRQRTGHSGNRRLAGENRGLAAVQDKRVKPCEAACQTPDLCHRGRRGEHRTCLRLCLADCLQHGFGKIRVNDQRPVTDDAFEYHVGRYLVIERHRGRPDNKLAIGSDNRRIARHLALKWDQVRIHTGGTKPRSKRGYFVSRLNAGEMRLASTRRQMARDVGSHAPDPDPLRGGIGATRDSFTLKIKVPVEMTAAANMEDRHLHRPTPRIRDAARPATGSARRAPNQGP